MNTAFIDILKKLTAEQGKEALLNPAKCKAFLADYTKGEYKKESRLLLQALEAGVQKEIITTVELEICKKQQIRVLQEEYFLTAEIAADVVDILALVLRGDEVKTKPQPQPMLDPVTVVQATYPKKKTGVRKKIFIITTFVIGIVAIIGISYWLYTKESPEQIYKIGDTGPAGGIIFYDKGSYSDGWRYLETAPASTEKESIDFESNRQYGEISDRSIGAGLNNTRIYLEKLRTTNVTGNTAPWICDTLVHNGYSDWFLPSLDELLLIYNNLRNNRVAGFSARKYWSSTNYPINSNNPGAVYFVDFSNGQASFGYMGEIRLVRAVRRF
jgi:hypothetical protein